jgi:2-keto-3-deoxy-L-rhamnonate aldolase RhmA
VLDGGFLFVAVGSDAPLFARQAEALARLYKAE